MDPEVRRQTVEGGQDGGDVQEKCITEISNNGSLLQSVYVQRKV